uniref:EH domain-containing protein n=1 Tax=Chrysotila carterae TaxID=13221 RepID=A0A7S4BHW6_CHRCT
MADYTVSRSTSPMVPLNSGDIGRYDGYFAHIDQSRRGVVSIDDAWQLFEKSPLEPEQLDAILDLVLNPSDEQFTLPQFRAACHLIALTSQVVLRPQNSQRDVGLSQYEM